MRMTPEVKVFLYMVSMADAQQTLQDPRWFERYHLDPQKTFTKLVDHGYLQAVATGNELTAKARKVLGDIDDWLWIHEYYLPGVIDFPRAKRLAYRTDLQGYPLVQALLDQAKSQAADDQDYLALLLRHQLKLEFGTHHDHAAVHTLMQLMYSELDVQNDVDLKSFNYHSSWLKVTSFEKQLLKQLLGRLNQTVDDFEMAFAQWLQTMPSHHRFFTNFEVMTIVMYELGNDDRRLDDIYHTAALRRLAQREQNQESQPHSATV
ncbi:hypothetical protein [Lacticaseibacillus porcinae]|uniref:hypothetical protein n=1 Tax=Lacticaseibacillus porcinae TaxID=1123687 RepID=UPI000F78EFB8|nr:hypothetical protein [Lacticaseibacillus porcinae]